MKSKCVKTRTKTFIAVGLILTLFMLPYCYPIASQYTSTARTLMPTAAPPGVQGTPTRDSIPAPRTDRVIVILARLSDAPNSTSVSEINSTIFQKMESYYDEVSYQNMTITGNITTWLSMPNSTVEYGKDSPGVNGTDDGDGDGVPDSWWLIRDIVKMTDSWIDFAKYDTVLVVHSGEDQAQHTTHTDDIWSAYYSGLEIPTNDGVTITSGIIVAEQDPMGIFAHEFGHSLGLPDLYNANGGPEFVGNWDLMADGAWLGSPLGTSPSQLTSWCRIQLGWITDPSVLFGRSVQGVVDRLEMKGTNFTAIKIPLSTDTYYLVEVRQKILYDSYLPDSGVLVLYVDESLASGGGIVKVEYSHSLSAATYTAASGNNMYIDSGRNVNITVLSAYSSSYRISVGLINPDRTPPRIDLTNPIPFVWPTRDSATVGAVITDIGPDSSSVKNATLFYSSDDGHSWNAIQMIPGTGDLYSATIPPQGSYRVEYYIEAYDRVGNLAISNNAGTYYSYYDTATVIIIVAVPLTILVCGVAWVHYKHSRQKAQSAGPTEEIQ